MDCFFCEKSIKKELTYDEKLHEYICFICKNEIENEDSCDDIQPEDYPVINSNVKNKIKLNHIHCDEDGWVRTYYGSWNIKEIKPACGVIYFMLDIHIEKLIEKHKNRFVKEISQVIDDASKNYRILLKKESQKIELLNDLIEGLNDLVTKEDLKLKYGLEPKIPKKRKRKTASQTAEK